MGHYLGVWDAYAKSQASEAQGATAEAERWLLRAIRLSDQSESWERLELRSKYMAFLARHLRLEMAQAMMLDLITDARAHPSVVWDPLLEIIKSEDERRLRKFLRRLAPERVLHPWDLLRFSETVARRGAFQIAIDIAKGVRSVCAQRRDEVNRWRAEGQMGRIYARAGDLDKAEELWWRAFREGSSNRIIADRLSLLLERSRRYSQCADLITEALERIHDPVTRARLDARKKRVLRRLLHVQS